jgi:XTP/dITP diphosphohydrolase
VREQVWDKINEEFNELKHEIKSMNHERTEKEFGDLFFSLINAARLYGINPENALERTNQKFIRRFSYLESKTIKNGKPLKEMNLDEMNIIWEESKQTDE